MLDSIHLRTTTVSNRPHMTNLYPILKSLSLLFRIVSARVFMFIIQNGERKKIPKKKFNKQRAYNTLEFNIKFLCRMMNL